MQAEGYKFIFEEARRQKPVCSMALNWCFNEPWPSAANNNLVSWPHQPKPAYYAVQAACRPVLASARVAKFSWQGGETFEAEIWILNEAPTAVAAGRVAVSLEVAGSRVTLASFDFPELAPKQNFRGPTARGALATADAATFTLTVHVIDRPELDSSYTFSYRAQRERSPATQRALNS